MSATRILASMAASVAAVARAVVLPRSGSKRRAHPHRRPKTTPPGSRRREGHASIEHLMDWHAIAAEAGDGPAGAPGPARLADRHASSAPPSVLVVDNECPLLKVMIEQLEQAGFGVIWAANGEDAVWLMETTHGSEALVTDVRLAGALSGWDVAQQFRQIRPAAPVFYTSGHSDLMERPVTRSIFVRKPYRPAEIVDKIQRLIGSGERAPHGPTQP